MVELLQLFGIRLVVNPVDKGLLFLPCAWFADQFGHLFIGQQHELLDQLVGILRLLEEDAGWFSGIIHDNLHFYPVEINGSAGKAFCPQFFSKCVEGEDLRLHLPFAGFDDRLCLFVAKSPVRENNRPSKPLLLNFGIFIQLKYG